MPDKPRIRIPAQAKQGEIIRVKTLISHVMENGLRRDRDGKLISRKIINTFTCEFNGKLIFRCDLDTAIAANPYLQFAARIDESGVFRFAWLDDDGTTITAEERITVVQ